MFSKKNIFLAMTNVIYIFDVPNIYNMNVFIMYKNAVR